MGYVLFAFVLFCASVMTHLLFCRGKASQGLQARAFVIIAIFFLGIYAAGVWAIPQGDFKITAGVIFVLLVPIYLCFYVLTQLVSPSKKILSSISSRESLSYVEIVRCIEDEDFIHTRLIDLEASGCVRKAEGRYRLTISGRKISSFLDMMQCILGRAMGG